MAALHKTKQYLLALAKVLVVASTFGYIFYRLRNNPDLDFMAFANIIFSKGIIASYFFLIFLISATINWYFEILKWQNLVGTVQKIDFKTALRQSLASLTVSLATPNRIGEYGAKVLYFEKEKRKKVLLLNFYSNAAQLSATLLFGMLGIIYFIYNFEVSFSAGAFIIIIAALLAIILLGYFLRKKEIRRWGFTMARILRFFQKLPSFLKFKIFLFSIFRYLIFSSMFYGLLLFFGAEIITGQALALIFTMYLLVSIVPTIFIFDVVVRGGVAVWLFSFVGVPELTVLSTVLAMWIFNFVIPSIIGSYYVLGFQPATQ